MSVEERLARVEERLVAVHEDISRMREEIQREFAAMPKRYVTWEAFKPVRMLVYGLGGMLLVAMIGMIITASLGAFNPTVVIK